ncbi:MAG: enoyl-CoA hydratase-related protein [Azospirillaceae bacterium]
MTVRTEIADRIARVTLDNPPVNALTLALYEELGTVVEAAAERDEVNVVLLTGAGRRAFCAGLDLREFLAASVEDDAARAAVVRRCFARIRHAAVPVIAAVNGPALGAGAVVASVCDIRLAADHATFGMPEIDVGRCGGAAHLGRHFPPGVLRRMAFTGQPIGAAEALHHGFVSEVVPFERLAERARALASVIAGKAPLGLRLGKKSIDEIEFLPVEAGYEIEQGYSTRLMATADAREAARAIVEKRKPVFVGR